MDKNKIKYSLRPATKNDLELSYRIKKNALGKYIEQTWGWDEKWQREYHLEEFTPFSMQVIESDNQSIGTLELIHEENSLIISGIYIIDSFQSKGIGKSILYSLIERYNDRQIKLQVLKVNTRAKEFYQHLGFNISGENSTHYQMMLGTESRSLSQKHKKKEISKHKLVRMPKQKRKS